MPGDGAFSENVVLTSVFTCACGFKLRYYQCFAGWMLVDMDERHAAALIDHFVRQSLKYPESQPDCGCGRRRLPPAPEPIEEIWTFYERLKLVGIDAFLDALHGRLRI